jgi:hypothetical protein
MVFQVTKRPTDFRVSNSGNSETRKPTSEFPSYFRDRMSVSLFGTYLIARGSEFPGVPSHFHARERNARS